MQDAQGVRAKQLYNQKPRGDSLKAWAWTLVLTASAILLMYVALALAAEKPRVVTYDTFVMPRSLSAQDDNEHHPYTYNLQDARRYPDNHYEYSDIQVDKYGIRLEGKGVKLYGVSDTHSMEPVLSKDSHVLMVDVDDTTSLREGDVVSYDNLRIQAIHRIMSVRNDTHGEYYIMKGDNNIIEDPVIVRRHHVKRKLVGIIY